MSGSTNLQSLFAHAVEIDDEAKCQAFVAAACGDDGALRSELEGLVAAHRQAGGFMELPAAADLIATASLNPVGEQPGTKIGPYKLLEQIGEGGMGLVFMAEQMAPLRRRVALKIIRPGLDTRAVIARFEAERQALALMDHPNIARVYDAGATESGRPYFVMELVRGAPITDYCRERSVPLRERLELFITVCQAVQHAHQKGIIHRDLKPTNILVSQTDTAPIPKVIDFGVAKATASQSLTDRTLFTAFSQIVGTPLYMSPEQADLGNQDVDTRSDVYSLGVVFYELLTGATPFDASRLKSAGPDEMRRIIREEEPPRPSTRATTAHAALSTVAAAPPARRVVDALAIKGDLDWIVMKALEKDRRRRYESPSALAADVARHLASEPVEASPPMRSYRLLKFVRRNRAALVTAGAVAMALVIGMGISIWQTVRASDAERRASQALETAEARLKIARQAVDEMYTQVVEKWLSKEGALTSVQCEFLRKAVSFYQDFAAQNPDSLQGRLDVANALRRQAKILDELGDVAAAEAAYRKSIQQLDAVLPELSNPIAGRYDLATSLLELGEMMRMARRYKEATPVLKRAVSLFEELVAQDPSRTDFRGGLGRTLQNMAKVDAEQGRNNDAETILRRCSEHYEWGLAREPRNTLTVYRLANATGALAGVLTGLGRLDDARAQYQRSIELHRRAVEIDPAESLFRSGLANQLINASAQEAVDDHLKVDQEAYEISLDLVRQFPDRPRYLLLLVVSQINFIESLVDIDQKKMLDIARSLLEPARRLHRLPGNPDYHRHFVDALLALHQSLLANELPDEAAEFRRQTLDEVRADPACRGRLGDLMKIQAADLYIYGNPRTAISLMQECLELDASQAGPIAHVVLALAYAEIADITVARTWLDKALPLPEPRPKSELSKTLYGKAVKVFDLKIGPKGAQTGP
jgi:serine/threonine protein kinase/tetratricopeptide (TPR) repeat protein